VSLRAAVLALAALAGAAADPPGPTLETIDASALTALRRDEGPRLRLIAVWATWCAPCVVELPDLARLQRDWGGPRFEVVTVSVDEPAAREEVLSLLRRKRMTGRNTLFTGDTEALVSALDPSWDGGLPFALLVAPGGHVVVRSEGALEIDAVTRALEARLGPGKTAKTGREPVVSTHRHHATARR
jgi:thiol-disulfide isomerase/thioredoxin